MSRTKFDVCSYALTLAGGTRSITSFDGDDKASQSASILYEPTVEALLAERPWTFARQTQQLRPSTEVPDDKWDAIYPLPPTYLLMRSVRINDTPIEWDVLNNAVYCNAGPNDVVIAEYTFRASEAEWSAPFLNVVHMRLASLFAAAVTRKTELANYWNSQYELALSRSGAKDSQTKTAARLQGGRILTHR